MTDILARRAVADHPHVLGARLCPEAIAQWATFGEREDNYFQRLHQSDDAWAERNSGQRHAD